MELRNAVCIVTGASSGIGKATAILLARNGGVVVACARRDDKLEQTIIECRRHSPQSVAIHCDVSEPAAVQAMVDEVLRGFGRVDVLVANAGVGRYRPFVEETLETMEEQVNTNLLGQMYFAHAVLPHMQKQRRGHLVLLSSTNGRMYPPMMSVYNATRAGTIGLGEGLIPELKPYGIGVTVVYPGAIDTEFFDAPEFRRMRKPKAQPAEKMAAEIVKGIERDRTDVTFPRSLKFPAKLRALFPGMVRSGTARYAKDALPKP